MGDDVFSELEKTRLKELFDRLDTNGDGLISPADLKALCAEFGHEISTDRANELVARCDPDGTGDISWEHFCIGMAIVFVRIKVALILVCAFKALDTDNSGYITADNLKGLAAEYGAEIPAGKIDEFIAKADTAGDGQISFQEFIQALVHYLQNS